MKIRVQDEEVSFNLFEIVTHTNDKGACFKMDVTADANIDVPKQKHTPTPLVN